MKMWISLSGLVAFAMAALSGHAIEVEEELLRQIQEQPTTGYAIFFRERADLSAAYEMNWADRGHFVADRLQKVAESEQSRVRAYLAGSGASFQSFWIDNMIVVEASDGSTFDGLLQFNEIAMLRTKPEVQLFDPMAASDNTTRNQIFDIAPNIAHVHAPDVWDLGFRGQGMVVGSVDSGVHYTHESLVNQYRGNLGNGAFEHNYNWWGGHGVSPYPVDVSGNSHGTRVTGVMVGDDGIANRIGMAPGAQWIACSTSRPGGGGLTVALLIECAEFLVAPWDLNRQNADPDRRPHIVNNSWSYCQDEYQPFFQGVVDAWRAAGMVPVFANGNAWPFGFCGSSPTPCASLGNPARYRNVISVGSTGTYDGQYADYSLKGPTDDPWDDNPLGFPTIKPNVVAPGVDIFSATAEGDNTYGPLTGTSFAAPHVSGLIALLWQAAPCLIGDYVATAEALMGTATEISFDSQCGGEGPDNVPNHATGWGEINALSAINAGFDICGVPGSIEGVITRSDSSQLLEGAVVTIVGPDPLGTTVRITVQADGAYQIAASPGTYAVTASLSGFVPEVMTVEVSEADSATADFSLDPAPIAVAFPDNLQFKMTQGDEVSGTLSIGNVGNADLNWSIGIDMPVFVSKINSHDPELDKPIGLPDFTVTSLANGGKPITFPRSMGTIGRVEVVGFSFIGTASGISGANSWASDTCMVVQSPDGTAFGVGGVNGVIDGCGNENTWDFHGVGSSNDGTYESTHDNAYFPAVIDQGGDWIFTFVNDWNSSKAGDIDWSDVTVTLHRRIWLHFCEDPNSVDWINVIPNSGVTPVEKSDEIAVVINGTGLAEATYFSALCFSTNDPYEPLIAVPVTLMVQPMAVEDIFRDRFEMTKGQ